MKKTDLIYNESFIETELQNCDKIISLIETNQTLAFELQNSENNYAESLKLPTKELPLFNAFWWGFGGAFAGACIGYGACWTGIATVAVIYLITEDKEQTKQAGTGALIGCLAGAALYVGVILLFIGTDAFLWSNSI